MPARSECLQLLLKYSTTPCFIAMGSEPCTNNTCLVRDYLDPRDIDPYSIGVEGYTVDWALHHICYNSIHNPQLSTEAREQLEVALVENLRKGRR